MARKADKNYHTLRNYMIVCRAYELSQRRDNLTFTHHQAISASEDRDYWLERASEKSGKYRVILWEISKSPLR